MLFVSHESFRPMDVKSFNCVGKNVHGFLKRAVL